MEDISITGFIDDFCNVLCIKMDTILVEYNRTKNKKQLELYNYYAQKLVKAIQERRMFDNPKYIFEM